jgi:DNA-binding response OmpR family regulator
MKILVVDDDRRMARTTCDVLRIKGYDVVAVYSGEEAVQRVQADALDCVIMDVKMSGINGVEALKQIKEKRPKLPVVLVSAYASDEIVAEAKRSGADAVVAKPVNLQNLLSFLSLLSKEESVLVVDDDPNFRKTLSDLLTVRGFHVDTESKPERVLGELEKEYKLVVLLDLKLGSENGIEVLKRIRSKYPTKPVVLITGYREEMGSAIQKGLEIGAYACLYKPFEADRLVDLIEAISRSKRSAVLGGE